MRGILAVTLVLCALTSVHVGMVEVSGWSLRVIGLRFGCAAVGLMKRSWTGRMFVRLKEALCGLGVLLQKVCLLDNFHSRVEWR